MQFTHNLSEYNLYTSHNSLIYKIYNLNIYFLNLQKYKHYFTGGKHDI